MKMKMSKEKLKPYLPLIATLILGAVLFFLVEDFIGTVFVVPILHAVWFVSVIVKSLPQALLWGVFVFVMLIITFSSSPKEDEPYPPGWHKNAEVPGTIEKWANILELAQKSQFSKWRLAYRLKRLTLKLLSPVNEKERVKYDLSGLDLPEEISSFFEAKQPSEIARINWFNRANDAPKTALDLDVEVVLRYLEGQLNRSSSLVSETQEIVADE